MSEYLSKELPKNAREWKRLGFENHIDILKWHEAGFTPQEAKEWNEYFTVDGAKAFSEKGLTPEKAKKLILSQIVNETKEMKPILKKEKSISPITKVTLNEGEYTKDELLGFLKVKNFHK